MNKVLAIIIFSLTVFIICLWVSIDRFQKVDSIDNVCYTIKQNYNLFDGDDLLVDVYDTHNVSLVSYANQADAFICNQNDDINCKVKIKEVNQADMVSYNEQELYHYVLRIAFDINEIVIENCFLELHYPNQILRLHLGNIYYIEKTGKALPGLRELYGLSFHKPYLSLGAIVLTFENTTDKEITIKRISLPSRHPIYLLAQDIKLNSLDELDYQYRDGKAFNAITVKPKTQISLILGVAYEDDSLLKKSPIKLVIDDNEYYIDNFTFLRSTDLNQFDSLLYRGYIDDFTS